MRLPKNIAALAAALAAAAAAAVVATGGVPASTAAPAPAEVSHDHAGHSHGTSGEVEAHATWFRHLTVADLLRESVSVVTAEVVSVAELPAVTGKQAGSAPGATDIPHRKITLRRNAVEWGADPGTAINLVHALPPAGTSLSEDPAYRPGETYVLFLRRSAFGGMWQRVGIDGRIAVRDGRLVGLLPHGPGSALDERRADLAAYLEEVAR